MTRHDLFTPNVTHPVMPSEVEGPQGDGNIVRPSTSLGMMNGDTVD